MASRDAGSSWGRQGSSRSRPQLQIGPGQPHQIRKYVEEVGKTVAGSKKRVRWRFTFGEEGDEHEVRVHAVLGLVSDRPH